jgi:OOP family OmpA-OmpF porin
MKSTVLATVIGAGMLAACSAAWSQEAAKVYVGAGLGKAKIKNACEGAPSTLSCDVNDSSAFKFFGGYQFTRHFALELGYNDLGAVKASSGDTAKLSALELTAVGLWPLANRFAIYGKLGVFSGEFEVDEAPVPAINPPPPRMNWRSGSNTGLTFGIGARYELTNAAAVRAEWQRFSNLGGEGGAKLDVDVLSIGALLRF